MGYVSYIAEVARPVVGHGAIFQISPDALNAVHVRCVGRRVVDGDVTALGLDVRLHEFRAVGLQTISNDEKLFAYHGIQGFEELDDLRAL